MGRFEKWKKMLFHSYRVTSFPCLLLQHLQTIALICISPRKRWTTSSEVEWWKESMWASFLRRRKDTLVSSTLRFMMYSPADTVNVLLRLLVTPETFQYKTLWLNRDGGVSLNQGQSETAVGMIYCTSCVSSVDYSWLSLKTCSLENLVFVSFLSQPCFCTSFFVLLGSYVK